MPLFYDRTGRPMPLRKWAAALESDRRVALDQLANGVTVSTVWLGIDHRFGGGGPHLIFETMVFYPAAYDDGYGGPAVADSGRYSTEREAITGHTEHVQLWALWDPELHRPD
jgi:hypothetical protein